MHNTKGLWALLLAACFLLAACGGASTSQESSAPAIVAPAQSKPASSLPPEEEAAPPTIKMLARSHEYGSIVEVPQIVAETDSAVVDDINRRILEFVDGYQDYLEEPGDFSTCEIKCYPFVTEERVEIVLTRIFYPTYGSNGDLISFVYDWQNDVEITLDEAVSTGSASLAQMEEMFRQGGYFSGQTEILSMEPTGFSTATGLRVFFAVVADRSDGDTWQYIYSYDATKDDFLMYGNVILFEPQEPEKMAAPLFYQKITLPQLAPEWIATAWESDEVGARLFLQNGEARLEVVSGEEPVIYSGSYSEYALVLTLRLEGRPLEQVAVSPDLMYITAGEGLGTYMFVPA